MTGAYDWWGLEGRPEHLRSLDEAGTRMFEDPVLREEGIAVLGTGVDLERELLVVQAATADAGRARALLRERYGERVELCVVAEAEYVVEAFPWASWAEGARPDELQIWLDRPGDGTGIDVRVEETDDEVVITLREPCYQGAVAPVGGDASTTVRLARFLAGRRVVDGSRGCARPEGRQPG